MAKTEAEIRKAQQEQARLRGGANAVPVSETEAAINTILATAGANAVAAAKAGQTGGTYVPPNTEIEVGYVYTGKKVKTGELYGTTMEDEKIPVDIKMNEYYTWTPEQNDAFVAKLRKLNYLSPGQKITEPQVAQIWKDAVNGAAQYVSTTGGKNKMTVESYLSLYARNFPPAEPKLPTRNITQFAPEVIDSVTNSIYQSAVGRTATPEEIVARRKEIQDMINVGSVRTTVTKGGERVSTTSPAFSKEEAAAKITADLKADEATAPEAERRQAFEFNNLLNKAMAGGI